jgi:hypothetical protein
VATTDLLLRHRRRVIYTALYKGGLVRGGASKLRDRTGVADAILQNKLNLILPVLRDRQRVAFTGLDKSLSATKLFTASD